MELSELSYQLRTKRDAWWNSIIAGEWTWAAFYANDIEALGRQIAFATHQLLEKKLADPQSALAGHHYSPKPPTAGG